MAGPPGGLAPAFAWLLFEVRLTLPELVTVLVSRPICVVLLGLGGRGGPPAPALVLVELNLAANLLDLGDAPDLLDLQVSLLEVPHLVQALPGVHPAGLGLQPQQVPGIRNLALTDL